MPREKAQAAKTARPKVPMRRLGADCFVVALKRGNARGAKGAGHRHWLGSTGNGRKLRSVGLTTLRIVSLFNKDLRGLLQVAPDEAGPL
jgi:hypothetical protein